MTWKDKSKKCQWRLVELTFLLVEGDVDLRESFENRLEGSVMLSLRLSENDDIIADIESSLKISDLLTDDFLENLACWIYAEVKSGISFQTFVHRERSDVATFFC